MRRVKKRSKSIKGKQEKRRFYTKEDIFISRMASILMLPKERIKPLFSQKVLPSISFNLFLDNKTKSKKKLIEKGYKLEPSILMDSIYFVLNKSKQEITKEKEYIDREIFLQNSTTTLSALLLSPKPNENILDIYASSASKIAHLAMLMENNGEITAINSKEMKMSSLKNILKEYGVNNSKILIKETKDFGRENPNKYDKVLLNAPSSSEGTIYLKGAKSLRAWSIEKIKRYTHIQKELIESAFLSLKHGNSMIYSTHTLEPEENEGVITFLLNKYPNARLEEIPLERKDNIINGITKWSGNQYHKSVKKSIRILPSSKMMGSYIAKIFKE